MSRLVAHFQISRRLMNGKFDAYVLWPKSSKLNSRPVYCSRLYGILYFPTSRFDKYQISACDTQDKSLAPRPFRFESVIYGKFLWVQAVQSSRALNSNVRYVSPPLRKKLLDLNWRPSKVYSSWKKYFIY